MAIEVWEAARVKGRPARWAFRVTQNGAVVFESSRVSVRYAARESAAWLAELIDSLIGCGAFPGYPGRSEPPAEPILWSGALGDDCSAHVGGLDLHAEHVSGPARGGIWYCAVQEAGRSVFHTADFGVEPRSGEAARWLCEVVARAALAGIRTRPR
jgi:hypothetical protein